MQLSAFKATVKGLCPRLTSEQKLIDQLLNFDLFSWIFVLEGYSLITLSLFAFCVYLLS